MGKVCGIIKNNKHSYNDFGLKILSRELNPPSKKKIKETLPFMNGSYDFSLLCGENVYEERTIKYVFDFRYKESNLQPRECQEVKRPPAQQQRPHLVALLAHTNLTGSPQIQSQALPQSTWT